MCMGFVLNIDRKLYCMVQGLCLCSVLIYLSFMSVFWSARLTSIMKLRAVVDRSTYYSILNSFDQRSQYLSIKFLLPKQWATNQTKTAYCSQWYATFTT